MAWAGDVLGVDLWDKQREILTALNQPGVRRVGVKSCNGAGKTLTAAVAALTWLALRPDSIVVTTAPTTRQVRKLLWREIRKLMGQAAARGRPVGGIIPPEGPELKMGENWMAIGFSSDDPVNMLGWHAPGGVLVIMDEGNGVSPEIWDALSSVMVGENDRLLVIANPTESSGPFYNLWKDPGCVKFSISAEDTPNVKAGYEVIPGMISRAWVEDRKRVWGEDSPLYRSKVLAEFPDSSDDSLVPLSWWDIANHTHDALMEAHAANPSAGWVGDSHLGLDVARFGPDTTMAARAYAAGVRDLHRFRKASIPDTADWAVALFRQLGSRSMRVDADGLGSGVYDLAAQRLGDRVVDMHFGATAKDPERFFNAKAEWAWHTRMLMDPKREGGPIAMPRDDGLGVQLTACRWTQDRRGRIQVEPKDDLKKRIGRSPDEMDAAVYSLARLDWDVAVSVDPEVGYRPNPWNV